MPCPGDDLFIGLYLFRSVVLREHAYSKCNVYARPGSPMGSVVNTRVASAEGCCVPGESRSPERKPYRKERFVQFSLILIRKPQNLVLILLYCDSRGSGRRALLACVSTDKHSALAREDDTIDVLARWMAGGTTHSIYVLARWIAGGTTERLANDERMIGSGHLARWCWDA